MSNSFNQQPQYQGLQPAIPFERPLRSSTRSRTETAVHPPQVTTRSQQHQQLTFPTPAIQQPSQQKQQQQQNVQQIAQQAQQLQPPQNFSHPHQIQQQAAEVPSAVYHRITPGQKPRTREQILLDTQLEAEAHNHERSPHLAHYREEQRRRHIELEKEQLEKLEKQSAYEKAQAAATMASRRSRKAGQETLNKQGAAQDQAPQQQQQQQNTNQGQPITIPDD
ncbi:hypothetical protein V8F33_013472 [Rhypophila sp. PSN 637]